VKMDFSLMAKAFSNIYHHSNIKHPFFSSFISFLFLFMVLCLHSGSQILEKSNREKAMDGIIHIEDSIIMNIPNIPRMCNTINLHKGWINTGRVNLYYEEEGEAVPLVLLHGGPGSTHHYFHPYFSIAKGFARVIYYDQRGCGLSEYAREDGYSVKQAADDLDSLRQALSIDKWIVLGHSYGGLLAQYYSVKYPDSVAGLILVGSSLGVHIPLNQTRQYSFISNFELNKIRDIQQNPNLNVEQIVYNAHLNGDWKRQNYYKPSRKKIAQVALYEWKHDNYFRSDMGTSMNRIDLEGAFQMCPIPTLIIEGRWDLTWNTDKPAKLKSNHPQSTLIMFEQSSHSPFEDEPLRFFHTLETYIQNLPEIPPEAISQWKEFLKEWQAEKEEDPEYILRSVGWGRNSNRIIIEKYHRQWLDVLTDISLLLKLGFALYDWYEYEEALLVFDKMEEISRYQGSLFYAAVALIWQGHMLDLLGQRDKAIAVYQEVVNMNVQGMISHSQFGMRYNPSEYAKEKIEKPFERIENRYDD